MAYNTPSTAKELVGVELPQVLLNEACAIIHSYTPYRWKETTVTEKYSGDGKSPYLMLKSPIIAIDSLTIDDVVQQELYDYEIRHEEGALRLYYGQSYGYENIVVTYRFGFTPSHRRYEDSLPIVIGTEARVALYLKKNPLFMSNMGVSGASLIFSDGALQRLLFSVPKPVEFTAI